MQMHRKRRQGLFACLVGVFGLAYFLWSFVTIPAIVVEPGTVDVENNAACAVEVGGSVVCWGGRVGPDAIQIANVAQVRDVAVGSYGACALDQASEVSCWSWKDRTVVEYSSEEPVAGAPWSTAVRVPALQEIESISGGQSICAKDVSGTVSCAGMWSGDELLAGFQEVPSLLGAIELAYNRQQICGRMVDTNVYCASRNIDDPVGDGDARYTDTAAVSVQPAKSEHDIWCVIRHALAPRCEYSFFGLMEGPISLVGLQGASQVFEVGRDFCGLFDDAIRCLENPDSLAAEQASTERDGFESVVSVEASSGWACASESDGRVKCWGSSYDTLGDRALTQESDSPVVVAERGVSRAGRIRTHGAFGGLALLGAWVALRRPPEEPAADAVAA